MRKLIAAAPLLLTGCLGITPFFHVDEYIPPPPERAHIGELGVESMPSYSHEPAASKLYPTAGSIDWATGGSEAGFGYFSGDMTLEDVRRDNPDGFLKIRARLRSNLPIAIAASALIVFYDMDGTPLLAESMEPTRFVVEPFGAVTAVNGCLLRTAHTFKLFVIPVAPEPPAAKPE